MRAGRAQEEGPGGEGEQIGEDPGAQIGEELGSALGRVRPVGHHPVEHAALEPERRPAVGGDQGGDGGERRDTEGEDGGDRCRGADGHAVSHLRSPPARARSTRGAARPDSRPSRWPAAAPTSAPRSTSCG